MNKKDTKILLDRIIDLEIRGYICRPTFDGVILNSATANEILFHFKKKEELRSRLNDGIE